MCIRDSIYSDIFEALGRHDLSEVLPTVQSPCLVVAGADDRLTPPELSEAMVHHLPHGELFMLPHGTHFGPMEYPVEIADRMQRFIEERLKL